MILRARNAGIVAILLSFLASSHSFAQEKPGTRQEVEKRLIAATLRHAGGDKPRAAALLGIGLRTLYRKIQAYGIGPDTYR